MQLSFACHLHYLKWSVCSVSVRGAALMKKITCTVDYIEDIFLTFEYRHQFWESGPVPFLLTKEMQGVALVLILFSPPHLWKLNL